MRALILALVAAVAQDAGVPVRDQLNQLLTEACEQYGCDASVPEDSSEHIQQR